METGGSGHGLSGGFRDHNVRVELLNPFYNCIQNTRVSGFGVIIMGHAAFVIYRDKIGFDDDFSAGG